LTQLGTTSLTFDANGNMTTDQNGKTIRYDAWNRVVEQKSGSASQIVYRYDGLGRRVREGNNTIYYNNNWQAVEEYDREEEIVEEQYLWSPIYIDALARVQRDTDGDGELDQVLNISHDANFNVTGIIVASPQVPAVVERFQYDAYGAKTVLNASWNVVSGNGSYAFRHGFAGGKQDIVTGRLHFRNRDYDPTLGRWSSRDPIGFEGSPYNLYEYVDGNPIAKTDPTGLADCSKCTQAEMDKLLRKIKDTADHTHIWEFQTNSCEKWATRFEKNLPELDSPCLKEQSLSWQPSNAIGGGHAIYVFTLCGGYRVVVDHWIYYGGTRINIGGPRGNPSPGLPYPVLPKPDPPTELPHIWPMQ
jgi:RHS repeat-associated protein